MAFCSVRKKHDPKFYGCVAVNSIRMQHHRDVLIGVMQRLRDYVAVDYTLSDSVVEAIIQFLTCASLTMGCPEVFLIELQYLSSINVHVIASDKLTQTTEEWCSFEKGVAVMHCAELQHKQNEELRTLEKVLLTAQNVGQTFLYMIIWKL